MVVAIYFAVFERLSVLKICLEGINRLKKDHPDIKWLPFAVYTNKKEGDLLKKYGVRSFQFDNDFLGRKKNAGLKELLKLDWDYMMEIGSDDLIRSDLIDIYKPHWEQGVNVFGVNSCWFIETSTGRVARWKHNYAIGAGRCIKRDVFDGLGKRVKVRFLDSYGGDMNIGKGAEMEFIRRIGMKYVENGMADIIEEIEEPFGLWSDERQIALDGDSEMRLGMNGYSVKVLDVDPMVIDLKSGKNIHAFSAFQACDAGMKEVLEGFSKKEADGVWKLG